MGTMWAIYETTKIAENERTISPLYHLLSDHVTITSFSTSFVPLGS